MGGGNATLQCHPMSGDFDDHDQYTPTIDDHLTNGKVLINQVVETQPETQGVTLSCYAIRPRFWRQDGIAVSGQSPNVLSNS